MSPILFIFLIGTTIYGGYTSRCYNNKRVEDKTAFIFSLTDKQDIESLNYKDCLVNFENYMRINLDGNGISNWE